MADFPVIDLPTENFSVTIPNFLNFVGVVLASLPENRTDDILALFADYALHDAPEARRVALVEEIAHNFNLGFFRVERSKPAPVWLGNMGGKWSIN